MLYDLERTAPNTSDKISRIVGEDSEVLRAYSSASQHLMRITTGSDLGNQVEAVKQFLLSLEYDPDLLAVHNL
jgi:hypothetical protein